MYPDLIAQYRGEDLKEQTPTDPDDRTRRILVELQSPNRMGPWGIGLAEREHLI